MSTKINVTQEHINAGVSTCMRCPIALAIMEMFPGMVVSVSLSHIWIFPEEDKNKFQEYHIPKEVNNFILDFDSKVYGQTVKPFSFDLIPFIK